MRPTNSTPGTFPRDLSWLSFNERVLQEAEDESLPLLDRLAFLAIFSSNLDEFYRVRVASLRTILRLKKKKRKRLGLPPRRLLKEIHRIVDEQQRRFGHIFRTGILPHLEARGIHLVDDDALPPALRGPAVDYFEAHLRPRLAPTVLEPGREAPALEDRALYLVTRVSLLASREDDEGETWVLTPVPPDLPRFFALESGAVRTVMFLDDVIRLGLPGLFPDHRVGPSYAIKLSRDADLNIEDEYAGDLVDRIRDALGKRATGTPSRFLFDADAPGELVRFLTDAFDLSDDDLVPGGRYHNLHDLHEFPDFGLPNLRRGELEPLPHPTLAGTECMFGAIREKDRILHTPYQAYEPVLRFIEDAAGDPAVEHISATLYRVAPDSRLVRALIEAARRGVEVTAFVEVKARFDEARNLEWAGRMESAGVRTLYSLPGIKIHSKLLHVVRRERDGLHGYAYIGTGNFNERTSRIYADHGIFTADPELVDEVALLFRYLRGEVEAPPFHHLLVAPFTMRGAFEALVAGEEEIARAGGDGRMILKMNSLEDPGMIQALSRANEGGAETRLIVRGIMCLRPGIAPLSDRVTATSIVGRFLEHARVYLFRNGGDERMYIASADWMERNLSRRIEVACPVRDPDVRDELRHILALQMADTRKARLLDADQSNRFVAAGAAPPLEAQEAIYEYLRRALNREPPPSRSPR